MSQSVDQVDAIFEALAVLRNLLSEHGPACVCFQCTVMQEAEIAILTLQAYKLFLLGRCGKELADEAVIFARQYATGSDYYKKA